MSPLGLGWDNPTARTMLASPCGPSLWDSRCCGARDISSCCARLLRMPFQMRERPHMGCMVHAEDDDFDLDYRLMQNHPAVV